MHCVVRRAGRRRSPHGERGLKYSGGAAEHKERGSLPSRGAWIEMVLVRQRPLDVIGRSPHGERGLKYHSPRMRWKKSCRSPHGERGLKYKLPQNKNHPQPSLPSRGAWIEICTCHNLLQLQTCRSPHGERGLKSLCSASNLSITMSLPSRGAWIEIHKGVRFLLAPRSLPSRGAWIEIPQESPCLIR